MLSFLRRPAARVAPRGDPGRLHREPRGSAPRERDHRGGDHPVPSRTRQLSPPSPRVLQRQAAGGQGVALAEGAFLQRAERPGGDRPLRAFRRFWGAPARGLPGPSRGRRPPRGCSLRFRPGLGCLVGCLPSALVCCLIFARLLHRGGAARPRGFGTSGRGLMVEGESIVIWFDYADFCLCVV